MWRKLVVLQQLIIFGMQEPERLSNPTEVTDPPVQSRKSRRTEQSVTDPVTAAAKREKAEKIGRTVAVFMMPLLIVGMMIFGYMGAMHHQSAKDMPVVVAGSSSSKVADLAQDLRDEDPGALSVSTADSALAARDMVYDRKVSAAVVLEGHTATLYTASSAGASASSTVTAAVSPVLLNDQLKISFEDLAPLPDNDMSGLGAMFLATAIITAGYMPWSMVVSNSPELLRFRRAVPLLAGWSLIIAALGVLITGPILGVLTNTEMLPVFGALTLGVFAVGSIHLFFTRLFGTLAVIPGMLVLMVLGQPASNMGMSIYSLPSIFPVLHTFLPMPALGESLRAIMYFDGDGATKHLLVLALGAVAGLVLTVLWDSRKHAKGKSSIPTSINIASLHGGPRPQRKFWRYASLLIFPLGMISMMLSFMLGAMHEPTPRNMPVAVIGSTMEQAQQTVAGLDENLSGMFELTAMDSADEAIALIGKQEVVAAFQLPSASSAEATLYTAQAGGNAAKQVVTQVFSQIAGAQGMELNHDDLAPLPDSDNTGTVSMYLAMGWIMAGFMVIIVAGTAAPHLLPLKKLVPLLVGYSAFMSLVMWLIAGPFTGAVEGHFWKLFGLGVLTIFALALFTTIFNRLIGMFAILPTLAVAMFLGVPASNAALSIYMEPHIFTVLHEILPMPAAVEAIRSILYFDGANLGAHLMILGLWALVSFAVVVIIDCLKPVKTTAHPIPEAEIAALQVAPAKPAAPEVGHEDLFIQPDGDRDKELVSV